MKKVIFAMVLGLAAVAQADHSMRDAMGFSPKLMQLAESLAAKENIACRYGNSEQIAKQISDKTIRVTQITACDSGTNGDPVGNMIAVYDLNSNSVVQRIIHVGFSRTAANGEGGTMGDTP